MLTKAQLKLIKSLEQRKFRKETRLFVAEGWKTIGDLIACGLSCKLFIATKEWLAEHSAECSIKAIEVSDEDMKKASFLRTPQGTLALFEQPNEESEEKCSVNGYLAFERCNEGRQVGVVYFYTTYGSHCCLYGLGIVGIDGAC